MIYYLEDVEEGGETLFPLVLKNSTARSGREKFNAEAPTIDDMEKAMAFGQTRYEAICGDTQGSPWLTIKPRKGAAVLFYTNTPYGIHDIFALHGSCPTRRGAKWVAQQWINEHPWNMANSIQNLASFQLDGPRGASKEEPQAPEIDHLGRLELHPSEASAVILKDVKDMSTVCSRTIGVVNSWPKESLFLEGGFTAAFYVNVPEGACGNNNKMAYGLDRLEEDDDDDDDDGDGHDHGATRQKRSPQVYNATFKLSIDITLPLP